MRGNSQHGPSCATGTPQNWGWIGVGSLCKTKKPAISPKQCEIGSRLLLRTNRNSYMRFWLVPKSMTLSDLERRIQGVPKDDYQWRCQTERGKKYLEKGNPSIRAAYPSMMEGPDLKQVITEMRTHMALCVRVDMCTRSLNVHVSSYIRNFLSIDLHVPSQLLRCNLVIFSHTTWQMKMVTKRTKVDTVS